MSRRDPRVALLKMREHADRLLDITKGRSREDIEKDFLLSLGVVRLLEMLGEAARRVPEELQQRHLAIPWRRIINLRNFLIHQYDEIDYDLLWKIITTDLGPLKTELERIVS